MKTVLKRLAIGVLIVAGVALALLFTPSGDRPLTALFTIGDVESIDFAALRVTDNPNQFFMCPPGFCGDNPHADSPVLEISVARLRQHWRDVLAAQPRVELLAEHEDGRQFDYVQRSARFRFPDLITVRFISVSNAKSTLAIYSRSVYGKSDFGVNRERIGAWLKSLREGP